MSEEMNTETGVKPQMTEEQMQAFMEGSPSRQEVNKYMNNLYMTINGSFGMFQGYTVASIAMALKDTLAEHSITLDKDDFIKRFFEANQALLKEASESLNMSDETQAPKPPDADASTDREVDISVF